MRIKLTVFIAWICICVLSACSEPVTISAESRHRFSEELILSGQISQDVKHLALLSSQPSLQLWDISSKHLIWELSSEQLPSKVNTFILDKNNQLLIVAGENDLHIWETTSRSLFGKVNVKGLNELAKIETIALSNHAGLVGVGMTDGTVVIFNRASKFSQSFKIHDSTVNHLLFEDSGLYAISAGHDGRVVRWDIQNAEIKAQRKLPSRVSSLSIDEQQRHVFTSDVLSDQIVLAANTLSEQIKLEYFSRFRWFRQAAFVNGFPYLITSSPKSELTLWDYKTGKEMVNWHIETLSLGSTVLDMQINQTQLYTLSSEGVLQVWPLDGILNNWLPPVY